MTPRCPKLGLACSTAYKSHGCRCDACFTWRSTTNASYRRGERAEPGKPRSIGPTCPTHGVSHRTAYGERGCRCSPCVAWKIEQNAAQRAARKRATTTHPDLPPEHDVSTAEGQEALWAEFMAACEVDDGYLVMMVEASVEVANSREES